MAYHEIRVKPIVRYQISDYEVVGNTRKSVALLICESAGAANRVASAIARAARMDNAGDVLFEPVRPLRIDVMRGPGNPRAATYYELREASEPGAD
jgi:hypothetical protein